jgi:hypothetical protein
MAWETDEDDVRGTTEVGKNSSRDGGERRQGQMLDGGKECTAEEGGQSDHKGNQAVSGRVRWGSEERGSRGERKRDKVVVGVRNILKRARAADDACVWEGSKES